MTGSYALHPEPFTDIDEIAAASADIAARISPAIRCASAPAR
jgi:hypothetical protein